MKLYDLELSGNCYKVRLFAALAGIDLELEPVDLPGGDHKQSPFIALNPWGQVPVLADDGVVLRDSQAILVYLARQYGGNQWWPDGAAQQGEVMQIVSDDGECVLRVSQPDKAVFTFSKFEQMGAQLCACG